MPMPAIPEAIFIAARHGDQRALVQLLEITQPDIRRYARRVCRTSADAEDAAQEALWLLFRHVGTIRSLAAISGWIFTVIRRECLRLARRAGMQQIESINPAEVDAAVLVRPDAELCLDLAAAMEALPPHYREITLMRDVKEMTIDEIANVLGATRQTVKARLHRARLLIREYLTR